MASEHEGRQKPLPQEISHATGHVATDTPLAAVPGLSGIRQELSLARNVVDPVAPFSPSWAADPGVADFMGSLLNGVLKLGGDFRTFIEDMCKDEQKRKAVAESIVDGASRASAEIGNFVGGVVSASVGWAKDIANDPQKRQELIDRIAEGLEGLRKAAMDPDTYRRAAQATGQAVQTLVRDPDAAVKAIMTAAKVGADIIGLTDVWLCGQEGLLAISAYGKGNKEEALGHFGKAAYHGVFAAASVGSIAATGGAGLATVTALRTAGKAAAKEALEFGAKSLLKEGAEKIGKEVVGELAEKGLSKTIQEIAPKIADDGLRQLGEKIGKEGSQALTKEAMEQTMREAAETSTRELMEKMDVSGLVKDKTLKLLDELSGKSEKELREFFKNQGLKDPAKSAKELHAALRNGTADELLQKELVDGITKEIKEAIEKEMEAPFKERMRDVLRGVGDNVDNWRFLEVRKALEEQAEKLASQTGRTVRKCREELVEEYVEAGWKGAREGVEKAVREAVEKGVREAFKEFRERRDDDRSQGAGTRRNRNRDGTSSLSPNTPLAVDSSGGAYSASLATNSDPYYAYDGKLSKALDELAEQQSATANKIASFQRSRDIAASSSAPTTQAAATPTVAAHGSSSGQSSGDIG